MANVRKGDTVVVISGSHKGKKGKVLRVQGKRVVIEKVAMIKRHTKPSQKSPQGGIVEKEGSVHISNVMPVDPGDDKPTRVKVKLDGETRRRVGKSGTVIEAQK